VLADPRRVDGPVPDFSNFKGLDVAKAADASDFPTPSSEPDFSFGSPAWQQLAEQQDRARRVYDNIKLGRTSNLRNQKEGADFWRHVILSQERDAALKKQAMAAAAERGELMTDAALIGGGVAGAGALGAGAVMLANSGGPAPANGGDAPRPQTKGSAADPLFAPKPAMTSTGGTAELANEARPVPQVPASTDPREQAQAMIAKLNQMRRAAGGEVKEAPQMMADINRLLAMGDQSRNAAPPGGAYDYHMQAQSIIAKLNDMRRQAGGEVPQAAQMMAEARRLQAMGDQRRNAMQTR
jgi:hypothetical protein